MTPVFDNSWTLFLDRDGVINNKIPNDYVRNWTDFHFEAGALTALKLLSKIFDRIIVVTNQQGIGKGLYSPFDLDKIHIDMLDLVKKAGGRIDSIYYCPNLAKENPPCRKPNTGMAFEAKADYPEIDFKKSVMVGDSVSDIEFGKNLGMYLVYVAPDNSALPNDLKVNKRVKTLLEWVESL